MGDNESKPRGFCACAEGWEGRRSSGVGLKLGLGYLALALVRWSDGRLEEIGITPGFQNRFSLKIPYSFLLMSSPPFFLSLA